MTIQLTPPGFGSFAPVIRNRDGKSTIIWWLCSDYETALAHANGFVDKGFAHSAAAMEVLKPGIYQ